MCKTSNNANSSQPETRPDQKAFCHWFWYHSQELHGPHTPGVVTSREAALRLFQHFATHNLQSEDEAIRSMRQDRDGTLALSAATVGKAHLDGWDVSSYGKVPATTPRMKWDRAIFETSGAWFFFGKAIEEFLWMA
jgi:hypothetical protein